MIDYLKTNHLSVVIILFLAVSMLLGGGEAPVGSHTEVTSVTNPWVFNQVGQDIDYRFEGDTDTALLFTDASTDRVGISTNAPTDTLDVDGTADVSGTTTVGRFTQGGGITTLTDANGGAFTLTQAHMNSGVIAFAAGGAGQSTITITLPASSTLTTIIPNAGDFASWIYDSTALDAATTTTFATGAGMAIHEPDGGNLVVAGATQATLTCHRKANTDIECLLVEAQPG